MRSINRQQTGFTLVEMAVVLVVVGVLIGSGFTIVGAYIDNAKQSHTAGSLETTKAAMLNYVKVNKHMPCPDIDGDGRITDPEDKVGNECNGHLGTVPYDALGLSQGVASDDWGNVFGYGVHQRAKNGMTMTLDISDPDDAELLADSPGSYFYTESAPAFDLDTPPTAVDDDVVAESYTVCKRSAANDCSGAEDKELEYIQAVIVAYNVNGGVTAIDDCGTASMGDRETENCNGDMQFIKGTFRKGEYDDQLVTISAYEIKQQVLDILNGIDFNGGNNPGYSGEDEFIINQDLTNANDYNSATNEVAIEGDPVVDGDSLLVTGDVLANINMLNGTNDLTVEGNVDATVNGGSDVDTFAIYQSILEGGSIDLEDGNDRLNIGGDLLGDINAGKGNDDVTIEGGVAVTGEVNMGDGSDSLTVNGLVEGDLIGGGMSQGDEHIDELHVDQTPAEWDATDQESHVIRFDTIYFNDGTSRDLTAP